MDHYTQAAVCIIPENGSDSYNIGLKLIGAIGAHEGYYERQAVRFIPIAKKDPDTSDANEFIPLQGLVEHLKLIPSLKWLTK
jgi:hypothetical protein